MNWDHINTFLHHADFSSFDYVVFCVNVILFVFSRHIVSTFPGEDQNLGTRLVTLRVINLVLFLLYFLAVFFTGLARPISQTGLTLLVAFLIVHYIQVVLLRRFGREKEIDDTQYRVQTYQSEAFGLLVVIVAAISVVLTVINIWNLTSWLQATSVLGGLLLVLFSTKDVWAPENINGLILLYNGNVEPGNVIRVAELDLLAIVIQTTLTQTVFRDLITRHLIVLPNGRFRSSKIEILTKSRPSGLEQYVEFKIGYDVNSERVEIFLQQVWETAGQIEKAINSERLPRIRLVDNADHAVHWRIYYSVATVYKLLDARFAIARAAFDLSAEHQISLQTPLTHHVEQALS